MIPESYRDFFVATAGGAAALTGLIFVAISVFPERLRRAEGARGFHDFQVGAAGTLLVFSNALVVSLVALIPDSDLGWWAVFVGIGGLMFAAATIRSILGTPGGGPRQWWPLRTVFPLLIIFGFETAAGAVLIVKGADSAAIRALAYVLIGDLLVGIFRSGRLVGVQNTGWLASLRMLARGAAPAARMPTGDEVSK